MTLPFLPGYSFPDPTRYKFHKSQAFVYENGGSNVHPEAPGIGGSLLHGQAPPQESISSTTIYNQDLGTDDHTAETVPAWVAFGSQVLRFYGYFKEPVFSSQSENYRVRNVIILFFLEDDTLQILEPPVKNSGIPQGTFLRRHRAQKDDDSFVTIADFHLGSEFTIYGRTFFISKCDKFTQEFLDRFGRGEGDVTEPEQDPYTAGRTMREYNETHRQIGVPKPEMLKLRQFLANDGHVLRFYAFWDDRREAFGDLRDFVINYFLADDTMEVREINSNNNGRDHFPSFVHRSQIPKEVLPLDENDPRFLPAEYYYRPTDFKIGGTVSILSRNMVIFDCDPFTRTWYKENMGYTDAEMAPLPPPQQEESATVTQTLPPPALIGGDEDTMRSVLSLHPKPAPKDQVKLLSRMNDLLRFKAQMVTTNSIDASRHFIITFYLSDDTVQIYEPPQRNSGIIAGKYLQRMKIKNPDTNDYFRAEDLEIGKVLTINRQQFLLQEATEYAMSYMEADPDTFAQADLSGIVDRLRMAIKQQGLDAKDLFMQFSDGGKMGITNLMALFKGVGAEIRLHEAKTVMRRYQLDSDIESFTLREFLSFAS